MVAKPPRKPQRTSYAYHTNKMKAKTILRAHSDNLMAIIALIFFCFLFFYQEKKRKSGRGGGGGPTEPKEVGARERSPRESPNEPPAPIKRTP